MDIGTIVAWVQAAIWIAAGADRFLRKNKSVGKKVIPSLPTSTLTGWLIVLGLIVSGVSLYLNYRNTDLTNWQSRNQETIYAKSYHNETVELDGKIFDHCHFTNVKLLFHGRAPVSFNQSDFNGEVYIGSDNIAIRNFMTASAELDKIKTLIRLHNWVEMDKNGNPTSVQ